MVNGEEPSAVDAVPLRRATPDAPDQPSGGELPAPAAAPDTAPDVDADPADSEQPVDLKASTVAGGAPTTPAPAGDAPATSTPAGGDPTLSAPAGGDPALSAPAGGDPALSVPAGGDPAGAAPAVPVAAMPVRHRRTLVGRGVQTLRRLPAPHRIAASAARRTAVWARRPNGRLALAGLFIAALLALTGAAGAYLVPAGAPVDSARPAGQESDAAQGVGDAPSTAASAPDTLPSAGQGLNASSAPLPNNPAGVAARPADALAGWAQHMTSQVDVPVVALQAYGYAELVVAQSTASCHLSWTTLAAIGSVESNHGSSNGASLHPDGQALPMIVGAALDGQDGRQLIADTDHGELDNDTRWDRAVGPMQFIPSTWRTQAVDADNDGIRNPNDIDDAALAAANYLCSAGRDLATPAGWWGAIAAYNMPQSYGQKVFQAANEYGTRSQG